MRFDVAGPSAKGRSVKWVPEEASEQSCRHQQHSRYICTNVMGQDQDMAVKVELVRNSFRCLEALIEIKSSICRARWKPNV